MSTPALSPAGALANPLAAPPPRRRSSVTMRDVLAALSPDAAPDAAPERPSTLEPVRALHTHATSGVPLLGPAATPPRRAARAPTLRSVVIAAPGDCTEPSGFTEMLSPLVTAASGAAAFDDVGLGALLQPLTKQRQRHMSAGRGSGGGDDLRATAARARAARAAAEDLPALAGLGRFACLCCVLALGYALYRLAFCDLLAHWQCHAKPFQRHWSDVFSLLVIGGTLAATGPTLRLGGRAGDGAARRLLLPLACVAACFTSAALFGLLGELPFLKTSLATGSSWAPPAVYVYAPALACVALSVVYALARSLARSWAHFATSLGMLAAVAGVFGSAVVLGAVLRVPFARLKYQPHHYQLGWAVALLLRHPSDRLLLLLRWVFLGIALNGLAAYGVDPIFGGAYEQSGCLSVA